MALRQEMETRHAVVIPRQSSEQLDEPWSRWVRKETVAGLRQRVGSAAAAIVAGVRQSVPDADRLLSGPVGSVLVSAIQAVLLRGVDAAFSPPAAQEDWTGMFRSIGALAYEHGCPANALTSAYRVTERILSDQAAAYGKAHAVSGPALRDLTDAIAHHVQRLSMVSAEGHAAAANDPAGSLRRQRQELLGLLLTEPPAPLHLLADLARSARWPIDGTVVAVALRRPTVLERPTTWRVDRLTLSDLDSESPCLVVAADLVAPAEVADAFPGWRAAIGPAVPITKAAASLRLARRALDLADRNLLTCGDVVSCAEHALELTLFADEVLLEDLIQRRLAPLAAETTRHRQLMLVTLREWLGVMGRVQKAADRLSLHPQTVRYRVHQLEQLFQDQLTHPQARLELELAVRAELLRNSEAKAN